MKRATSRANGATPLYEQLCESLRAAIAGGRLEPGTRLPSTRTLARELRISRNTVVAAYEQLALEGLLVATIGSGTRVRGKKPTRTDSANFLRNSGYPADSVRFSDVEGNEIYLHR
jgi:GntR family transcriptional regulator/MocR family aminotransferase